MEGQAAESPLDLIGTALQPSEIKPLLLPLDEREREVLRRRYGLDGDLPS